MNDRYHCIYTLQFAQRPFWKKKILVEEPPVLTNLYFQLQEEGEEEGGGRESCKIPHPIHRGRNK